MTDCGCVLLYFRWPVLKFDPSLFPVRLDLSPQYSHHIDIIGRSIPLSPIDNRLTLTTQPLVHRSNRSIPICSPNTSVITSCD